MGAFSSPGWKMSFTVPGSWSRMPQSTLAVASSMDDVRVVAAGVHDAVVLACEGQAGLLLDGQSVDVRADGDAACRAWRP